MPDTSVTMAQVVPMGEFQPPPAPNNRGPAPHFEKLPAFCRIAATLKPTSDSDIKIEVWLPVTGWNGKLRGAGNGGLGGFMDYRALAQDLGEGFATVGSDEGHEGGSSYAIGHPQKIIDFGYRSVHLMTVRAKTMIAAYYGTGPKVSYMDECGGGSIAALSEAQRFPEDYDAIAAGGFGADVTHHTVGQLWTWYAVHSNPESYIPPEKYPLIHQAALNACDAKDGLKDGVIQAPEDCKFDPGVLLCKAGDSSDCLTAPQVEAARKIYAGPTNPRTGAKIFSGLYPGSELTWGNMAGAKPFPVATDWFTYFVFKDPNWNYQTHPINFDSDVALSDSPENLPVDAIDPDLTKFAARGGKLLLYGGWNDTLIAPGIAVDYYKSIVAKMGARETNSFMRFYMIPGMGHCPGVNGADAYDFDSLAMLERWKEDGQAPGEFVATHYENGVEKGKSLECQFPDIAFYKGSGSPGDPANFTCKKP